MKIRRRSLVHLAVGAAALPLVPGLAQAQAYPSRTARIVVGFPAGGATDIQARLASDWLSEHLGQQFVVDNKPGASGNIGAAQVARAPADGYTFLHSVSSTLIQNRVMFKTLGFDPDKDLTVVSGTSSGVLPVVVHKSLPAEVKDLKTGTVAIQERARNDLGMVGPDETFYQVIDPEGRAAPEPVAPKPDLPVQKTAR